MERNFTYIFVKISPTLSCMKNGTVKFFNDLEGYGFIKDTQTGQDYYVHVSGLVDEIRENDEVTYDLQEGEGDQGLNAVNVKIA